MVDKKVKKTKSKLMIPIIIDEEKNELMPEDTNTCTLSEIVFISFSSIVVVTLVSVLYVNMTSTDDWTADEETRNRVLVVAIILFCFNIFLCCYVSGRLGVCRGRPRMYEVNSRYYCSVNAEDPLLSNDQPPSYDAVSISSEHILNPPPSYEEVGERTKSLDPAQHQATG